MGKVKKKDAANNSLTNKASSHNDLNQNNKAGKIVKYSNEIEQLFRKVTKTTTIIKEDDISHVDQNNKVKSTKKKMIDRDDNTYGIIKSNISNEIVNPEAPLERIDKESGLPVYKAHLLKVGEGGGTALCPFDCNCCF